VRPATLAPQVQHRFGHRLIDRCGTADAQPGSRGRVGSATRVPPPGWHRAAPHPNGRTVGAVGATLPDPLTSSDTVLKWERGLPEPVVRQQTDHLG